MEAPKWIDEYALSMHQAFSHMIPTHWSSIDGFAVISRLQGTFLTRISDLADAHRKAGTSLSTRWNLFSNPSSLRIALYFLILEYQDLKEKEKFAKQARNAFDFLVEILYSGMKEDPWVMNSNKTHSSDDIMAMLANIPWAAATPDIARTAGRLYVSAASLAFGIYRDFFPQDGHEVYGPYDASPVFGPGATMVIKSFSRMDPRELWPNSAVAPWKNMRIYHVFSDVVFRCESIGMHSIYDKPVIPNTAAIAVEIDGKFIEPRDIKKASDTLSQLATDYSGLYEALSPSQKKIKFLEWECYQFLDLFKAVGMDWHPTPEMVLALQDADIPEGVDITSCPTLDELMTSEKFEIFWLKKLYQEKL